MVQSSGKWVSIAWWCLIVVSVVLIVTSPWHAWVPEEVAEGDERVKLAVLELQGRYLIGFAQIQPEESEDLEKQLVEMEAWAATDRAAAAVAAVRFFIDPEGNGKWRALALVNERLKDEQAQDDKGGKKLNRQLLENVRKALNQPDQLSDEERTQIRSVMGWFGKVLLSASADDDTPASEEAASLRMHSVITVITTGILVLVVMGVGLLGVGLLAIGLIMMRNGKLTFVGIPDEIPVQPYLGAFALYLSLMVLADFLSIVVHPLVAVVGMFGSIGFAFVWPRLQGLGWRESLRGFGWRRGKGIAREMLAGVIGYMAMTPVFALGVVTTLILTLVSGWLASKGVDPAEAGPAPGPITHPVVAWVVDGNWLVKMLVVFLASGLAPLFEETMFRGALYRVFRSRWGCVGSGLASGVIFAVVHPQGFLAIPALTAMGFGFAVIREWRGTLIASMTAHGLHNGILITTLLLALA